MAGAPPCRTQNTADLKKTAMTASPGYQTSPIERTRATKAEVEARREALLDIIAAGRPMTVRQVFEGFFASSARTVFARLEKRDSEQFRFDPWTYRPPRWQANG